jgi:hypothetical protein
MSARDDYDLNVWSQDNDSLTLTAYEQAYDTTANTVQTNTSKYHSITFGVATQPSLVAYLIEEKNPEKVIKRGLTDYDNWVGFDFLTRDETRHLLLEWLGNLPEYEMEKI